MSLLHVSVLGIEGRRSIAVVSGSYYLGVRWRVDCRLCPAIIDRRGIGDSAAVSGGAMECIEEIRHNSIIECCMKTVGAIVHSSIPRTKKIIDGQK